MPRRWHNTHEYRFGANDRRSLWRIGPSKFCRAFLPTSECRQSAVHTECLPSDPVVLGIEQERDGARHITGLIEPPLPGSIPKKILMTVAWLDKYGRLSAPSKLIAIQVAI